VRSSLRLEEIAYCVKGCRQRGKVDYLVVMSKINVNTAIAHRSSDSVFSYLTGMRTSWDGKQNSSTSLRGYEFELSHLGTMQGADL